MNDFELEKWYMDVHDENGRVLIFSVLCEIIISTIRIDKRLILNPSFDTPEITSAFGIALCQAFAMGMDFRNQPFAFQDFQDKRTPWK